MTSEGTDCQGQLVWPVFIYLFLNKRQVVTLEKGTQTVTHALVYRQCTHTHAWVVFFFSLCMNAHAYGYHPLNFGGAILLTFRKSHLLPRIIKFPMNNIIVWCDRQHVYIHI